MLKYFFLIFISYSSIALSADFEVSPMFLDIKPAEKDPNKPHDFKIEIKAKRAANIVLTFYRANQNEDGYLDFIEMNQKEVSKKIKIDNMKYSFPRAGNWNISGKIIFEKGKKKTEAYAVMVEEDRGENKVSSGVGVNVRYAVILKIQNSLKREVEKLVLGDFGVSVDKKNGLRFNGMIKNESSSDARIKSYAMIRNSKNKLVKQIDLNSKAGWKRKDKENVIFPNSQIKVFTNLGKDLVPDKYKVSIFAKIDGKKQISKSMDLDLLQKPRSPSSTQKNSTGKK
jgi:hypothetical protein